jgi:Ca2+/H+ antiporter, TMEM165/GDT1 family
VGIAGLGTGAASFLASGVEFVEALTIVLALGVTRGWRSSLWGAAVALAVLAAAVAAIGPGITGHVPRHWLQLVVGVLLLTFGLQWLRKAILRSTGYKALHDEEQAFAEEREAALRAGAERRLGLDWYAFTITFKGVLLEGLEVVFIVVGFGASAADRRPAVIGAAAALGLVLVVGIAVHRPLSRVPENLIKHGVGLLLSTFGLFWLVEGLNAVASSRHPVEWPGGDVALPFILLAWVACSQLCMRRLRQTRERAPA